MAFNLEGGSGENTQWVIGTTSTRKCASCNFKLHPRRRSALYRSSVLGETCQCLNFGLRERLSIDIRVSGT